MKLSTSIVGSVFWDTSKEELAGKKAEEEHWREEGDCGVMWKGKAAAEKQGRMLIQAGEQLGKMREVVKRVRQSWKISVHDIAVMWQNPYASMISMELSAQPCFLRWAGICEIEEYDPNHVDIWHGVTKLLENRKGEFNLGCREEKKNSKKPKAMDAAAKVRWIAYFAHTNNGAAKWLHMIAC